MTKTIVILGAGIVGVPLAHSILKHAVPKHNDLKVVMVSPNEDFYMNISTVRGALPGTFTDDQLFHSITKNFAKYPSGKFEFVAGRAESLDAASNKVVVALNNGSKQTIDYHTLFIATGTKYKEDMSWKGTGTSAQTRAALGELRKNIGAASSIVVVGGGDTGIEFTAELGAAYAKKGTKQITLITSDSLPLDPRIMESTRKTAKSELEKFKVKIIPNAKVTKATKGKKTSLELTFTDGTTQFLETDLYIPTFGTIPNSDFVPASMKDSKGQIKQDPTLRVAGYKNIFVVGDVGDLQGNSAVNGESQWRHVAKNIESYLNGGEVEEYKYEDKIMFALSLGPGGGTGQIGTWQPFSLMIWFLKSRYLGTNNVQAMVSGEKTMMGKI